MWDPFFLFKKRAGLCYMKVEDVLVSLSGRTKNMKKEIPFQEGKVVFFKESNFWDDVLQKCNEETKAIYIATYNFNFNQYEKSFYRKLSHLANLGVRVNLLYAKMSYADEDELEVEEIFKNFVLCAKLTTNHSKFFITDDFAFIGSALTLVSIAITITSAVLFLIIRKLFQI
jgi:hypothetical protein